LYLFFPLFWRVSCIDSYQHHIPIHECVVILYHNFSNFSVSLQVIAAGKPFQQGQLTPHLQITGENMIQGVQGVHQNGI